MDVSISITSATRKRKLKDGTVSVYPQWYVNFRDPKTGQRIRRAKDRKRDAEAYKADLLKKFAEGTYVDPKAVPTIGEAIDHWMANKDGNVKASAARTGCTEWRCACGGTWAARRHCCPSMPPVAWRAAATPTGWRCLLSRDGGPDISAGPAPPLTLGIIAAGVLACSNFHRRNKEIRR